jgi:uncharacterized protein
MKKNFPISTNLPIRNLVASNGNMEIQAGDFSSWLRHTRSAMLDGHGTDVACGDCVGCCSSSYFIHVNPDDIGAIERIRKELLFPVPGAPSGHKLMGYDKNGLCPMLVDGKCSIYEHRPRTCRTYDCRIFAAAGILAGGEDKAIINQRIRSWKFNYPSALDREEHMAVQAAAAFIRIQASAFPDSRVPAEPSQLAILAIKVYGVFYKKDSETAAQERLRSPHEIAEAVIAECRHFDSGISR